MPTYPWLYEQYFDQDIIPAKINAMRTLGVPYEEGYEDQALDDLKKQADGIVAQLKVESIETDPNLDIIALIAYLQRLGTDIKVQETASAQ
jgi:cytochrome c oxidase cbb3-type subunit I/II